MIQTTDTVRRVTTKHVGSVDDLLQAAVEGLIPPALALNRGIKVIGVGAGEYIVETAAGVACGYTVEEHR